MKINIRKDRNIESKEILRLYHLLKWSAAKKPKKLFQGLMNSDSLISAWDADQLVGIGNAISDGHLVVYYPHLLVDPSYQGQGIGTMIMSEMQERYKAFHMQMLTADNEAQEFYKKIGFVRAGKTEPMWIYDGTEH